MIRTIKQAQEELMAMRAAGKKELEVRDILKEHEGKLVCRIVSMLELGGTWAFSHRHEMWSDKEKYEQKITTESDIDGSQRIYMSGYAGATDEEMIERFDRLYPVRNLDGKEMLRDILEKICSPSGPFCLSSYKWPEVSEELLNEVNDWYCIKMPDSFWILRESDVPKGDFSYSEVIDLVTVFVNRKSEKEYLEEEHAARRKAYPEIWGDDKKGAKNK